MNGPWGRAVTNQLNSALEHVAAEIAITSDQERGRFLAYARVPWYVIDRLRESLTATGFDWQNRCREYHELMDNAELKPATERFIELDTGP